MITSSSNPHIVAIRKLADPKGRRESDLFLAEGLRLVGQAFDSHAPISEVIFSSELLVSEYGQSLVELAGRQGVPLTEVSAQVFASLARKDKPQGVAAVVPQQWSDLTSANVKSTDFWVALQAVQNPGNLGTILRTCDAVGAVGLILLDESTDPYDPTAVKASMGSIFTVPVYRANLQGFSDFLARSPGLFVTGTSDAADLNYYTATYPFPNLLLMGSERQGLPADYTRLASQMVSLPMEGACDSLNLSVAAGIMLYHIYQQRNAKPGAL